MGTTGGCDVGVHYNVHECVNPDATKEWESDADGRLGGEWIKRVRIYVFMKVMYGQDTLRVVG